MNIFQKPINFIKEVRVELGKVSWSTPKELLGSTAVVIVTTAIMAVLIGGLDVVLTKALQALFKS